VAGLVYIPINRKISFFAHMCFIDDDSHSDWGEVESQFDLHFPDEGQFLLEDLCSLWLQISFSHLVSHLVLKKCTCSVIPMLCCVSVFLHIVFIVPN
jgi:hypothetical protein